MKISEISVKLASSTDGHAGRVLAYVTLVLDDALVIHDLKVIRLEHKLLVAMPSCPFKDHCPQCGDKNAINARFCHECGARLEDERFERDGQGRAQLFRDTVHPINNAARTELSRAVLEAYEAAKNQRATVMAGGAA